jgi:hypothetical protein
MSHDEAVKQVVEYVGERHSDLGDVACKYTGELRYALTFRSAEGKRRFAAIAQEWVADGRWDLIDDAIERAKLV